MNTKDKKILQNSQELISRIMKERNADTDDCITTTNLARDIGIPRADFSEFLVDKGLLRRVAGRKQATRMAIEKGYAKVRYRFDGKLKEQQFPVWTPEGVMHLKRILRLIH